VCGDLREVPWLQDERCECSAQSNLEQFSPAPRRPSRTHVGSGARFRVSCPRFRSSLKKLPCLGGQVFIAPQCGCGASAGA
jgi:hypothetical protein